MCVFYTTDICTYYTQMCLILDTFITAAKLYLIYSFMAKNVNEYIIIL